MTPGEQRGESQGTRFLPNFCGIRLVFAVVVGAELLAIVLTLFSIREARQISGELSLLSLYVQWIALSGAGLLCAVRGRSRRSCGRGLWREQSGRCHGRHRSERIAERERWRAIPRPG